MRSSFSQSLAIAAILVMFGTAYASAHDLTPPVVTGDLKIEKIWARATTSSATTGVGYVMIANSGSTPDRLIGVETSIANTTEFHVDGEGEGDSMRRLENGIVIPSKGRAVLRPGSGHPHLVFMALNGPIKSGIPFTATLLFEKAGKVEVKFRIVAIGKSPAHAGH